MSNFMQMSFPSHMGMMCAQRASFLWLYCLLCQLSLAYKVRGLIDVAMLFGSDTVLCFWDHLGITGLLPKPLRI
jgi:hypothetical protein